MQPRTKIHIVIFFWPTNHTAHTLFAHTHISIGISCHAVHMIDTKIDTNSQFNSGDGCPILTVMMVVDGIRIFRHHKYDK